MKKNTLFFKTLGLFVTAMVSISVVSCTKDDDAKREIDSVWEEVGNDAVVGTWQWSTNYSSASITFNSDYTCELYYERGDETYTADGDYMMTNLASGHAIFTFIDDHDNQPYPARAYFFIINGKLYLDGSNKVLSSMGGVEFSK